MIREIRYAYEVPAPVEEVFAWHERPGAFVRLTPPFRPVKPLQEAQSLRDGTAVLGLPAGVRWRAVHQPDSYDPPHRFVDELRGGPLGSVIAWRHTHRFEETPTGTAVIDEIRTQVPERMLRGMFDYRHRQLADDLEALSRAAAWQSAPRTVAVTGSRGLVGRSVCALLGTAGHTVIRLVRGASTGDLERHWDPEDPAADLLEGVDAVIHLAGESIAGRFTDDHKRAVRESRIGPTRRLAERAAESDRGPEVFVSASAIGFYGDDRGDERLDERSAPGEGFLAEVVQEWEAATEPAARAGIRVAHVRTGIVQSPQGGTLQLLRPLFLAGLGGRLGDGRQWQSWIGIDDLADIYLRAVLDQDVRGPINAVAPQPVRNDEYTRVLGRVLRRPAVIPVPRLGPRLLLGGQGADELALADQRVLPVALQGLGHTFRHFDLETALRHVLR